ncbi:MAG: hypothetical protein M1833_000507 [Piccolia ochrophora]|nr:MAG: hypothetical protein M1833_000507 [Piccolia ochrophora]
MGDGELRVKQKFAIAVDAPVYALASYGHSSLVFSFGHEISVRSLDWTSKKFVRVAQHELKSPCLRITTDAPYIYITTLMDSTVILTLHNGTLIRHFSDTGTRIGQAHLALLESQVLLVSDRARCVTGLWYPFDGPRGTSLQTVFEAELPSTIFQLRLATLRLPWRPRSALPGVHNIGNEGAEIIGCGLNGSLFQFLVLSEQAWRLLRFIQNLSVRNVTIHPFPEEDRVASHIEPQETSPRSKHVDGDALGRLVASGSATLREMLDAKPRSEINGKSVMDFNSAAARMRRFSTLVKELLGEESGDPVAAAMEYVEALLTPVI